MKIFNAQKASILNDGNDWEVVDTRTGEIVKACKTATKAVAWRDYNEEALLQAKKVWIEFDARIEN